MLTVFKYEKDNNYSSHFFNDFVTTNQELTYTRGTYSRMCMVFENNED